MKHCGLRKGYANGGLLDSLDERMGWGKYAQAATAPTAMQQVAAAEGIEQFGGAQKFARLQEQADSIGGNSQLSNRQKARALTGLQQAGGNTGSLLTLPGVSGLSARQKLDFDTGNMQAANSVTDFNTRNGLRATAAAFTDSRRPGIGFAQGGTVDGKGYIHGEKGVDKVPAKVAETGEDILVSDGERIVNKKQNAALERLAAEAGMSLDEYLEQSTGEPVGPQMKKGLRAANDGMRVTKIVPTDEQLARGMAHTEAARAADAAQRASDAAKMDGLRTIRPNATHIGPTPVAPVSQAGFDFAHESPADSRALQARPKDLTDIAAAREIEARQAQAAKPSVQMNPVRGSAPGVLSADAAQHLQDQAALERRFAQASQQPAPAAQPAQPQSRMAQPSRAPYGAPEAVAGPSPTPTGAAPTRMQGLKAGAMTWGGRLNAAAQVATGVHDIATANEPAEQVMGGLKASGALPGIAGLPGKVAMYGDMALGMLGTSGAKLMDKALRLNPDYMLDKNREWGSAGTRGDTAQPAPAPQPATKQISTNDERFNSVDTRTPQEQAAAGVQAGLEAKGLRNAQQFLGGEGAAVPEGLRTTRQIESNAPLTTWNSKEDVAANSLRDKITPENGTGIISVRQKDGTFKNVAIGQAEYTGADGKPTSDWSKTQQYADAVARANNAKARLEQIKRERAEFAAFDPSITDPNARDAGLRAVSKYMVEDQLAQKSASEKAKLGLELDKFGQEERKIANLQSNSERDHKYKVESDDDKRLDDVLKSRATVDGKLNGKKYADYQRFVGNFKAKNAGENGKHRAKEILDAMELWEAYGEDDGSIFRRVYGQGSDMPTGLVRDSGLLWGENYVDPRTGRQISGTRVSELSPGTRAIFEQNRKQ